VKIAIIGGGWAGIAAAVELSETGAGVTLFEASRALGGRARSIDIDGRRLDNGQHILLGAYRETLALMRRVGADPDTLFSRLPLQVIDNSGFRLALAKLPAPLNIAWGLLTASGVCLAEKLKTALWMEGVKARRFQLDEDMTVAAWLDAAGQTGQLRHHLWEPLCLAALNTAPERASAQLFANVLRDSLGSTRREDTDLLLPRVDLGQLLAQPATAHLRRQGVDLRCSTRVQSVEAGQAVLRIDGESFDQAIIATAPQHLAKLCPALSTHYDYEPIATVYLQFSPEIKLPFPLLNLMGKHGQWVVDRDNGLLAAVQSGHGEWETLSDSALIEVILDALALGVRPSWHKVIREKRATFSCYPGLSRPAAHTELPRVFLAGDYTWSEYPATLEGAVRSGLRAANKVIQAMRS
jgi:squalene-associated FAD-dependent desaturase